MSLARRRERIIRIKNVLETIISFTSDILKVCVTIAGGKVGGDGTAVEWVDEFP
jgi:hypothetical protein